LPKIRTIELAKTSVKQVVVVSAVFAIPPAAIVSPYCGQKPEINKVDIADVRMSAIEAVHHATSSRQPDVLK
jgi:hypothetical protein